jgi:hypothetical protein
MLARFTRDVPRFLRAPISLEAARDKLRCDLASRSQRFLDVVDRAIYARPRSPYARLLKNAGCEAGDLRALVAREGMEGALRTLASAGVHVTFDEFKGRREAVRGSQRFTFSQREFDNPLIAPHYEVQTGGTGGQPSRVRRSLEFLDETAASTALFLDAHGLRNPSHAVWMPSPINWLLVCAKLRQPVAGWFFPLHPIPRRVRISARYLATLWRLGGHRFSPPMLCELQHPERMAAWLSGQLRNRRSLVLTGVTSSVVRAAIAAQDAGLDLEGLTVLVHGEPLTAARRHHLEAVGAGIIPNYASIELPGLTYGCASPNAADDVHLFEDRYALVQRTRSVPGAGAEVASLLFSSVSSRTPKICLNTELGDTARVEVRECGCTLGQLGLRTHLSEIKSFEKLTGEGASFAQGNVQRILEETLPARFGGTSVDYQLVEEESPDSATRLVLRISPSVGPLDDTAVQAALLDELGREGVVERHNAEVWRQVGTVLISREPPLATRAGKILPFHIAARTSR